MLNESDLVALLNDVPGHHLYRGDVGTVAYVYEGGGVYEVEFVNAAGETVAVVTLPAEQLSRVELENVIFHVRELNRAA
jgi:hypothetical protein